MALLGQRLPRSRIAESKATPRVSLPAGPGGQGAARLVLGPLARRTTTKRDPTLTAHQHPPGARVPETGAGQGAAPRGPSRAAGPRPADAAYHDEEGPDSHSAPTPDRRRGFRRPAQAGPRPHATCGGGQTPAR